VRYRLMFRAIALALRALFLALPTRTQFPQILETVYTRTMPVSPLELKRVLTDKFDFSKLQIVRNMHWQNNPNAGHLILACGARTHSSQNWSQMMRFVPIGPDNHQFAGIDFLDSGWSRRL
jgi:hypothetical protein